MRAYATPIAGGARSPARLGADAATWLAGVVFALATIAVLYPGQYTFDAAYQIWQARTGQFSNQSPVFMTGLWALLLRVTGNPASLLCVNVALLWTGLVLCVVSICAGTLARIALLAVCGLAPLTLVEMAHLLTDAHLAAVLVLAGGFAARWVATRRRAALCACLALALYAGCIRHNALLATLPFGAFIAIGLRGFAPRPTVTGLLGAIMLVAVSAAIGFGVDRAFTVRHVNMWPVIALWDLAAVSVDRHVLLLPPFTHGPGMTVDELSQTGAFDERENTLLFSQSRSGIRDGVDEPYSAAHLRELFEAWIAAAVQYPLAYAHHRLRTFGLLVGRHRGDAQGLAYFVARVGYRDNPPFPGAIAAGAQSAFYRLASELRPTWLFAALPYLLAHALAFVLAWPRRRDPMSQLALTISGSALLYALGYLPLAPAVDLRYLTWPIVAAPLALAFAWRARSGTSSSGVRISGA
jgi:hypothetical protein